MRIPLLLTTLATGLADIQAKSTGQDVLDWIQSKPEGYVSDKLVWKRTVDNDESSPFGMFALEDIPKGTHLMVIPHSVIVKPSVSQPGDECETARILLEEYHKRKDSNLYPYVDFLFGDVSKRGVLPSAWTREGQKLLRRLLGRELMPRDPTGIDCWEDCPMLAETKGSCSVLEKTAYYFVISRAWGVTLIPGFDMLPHRNGKWHNVDSDELTAEGEVTYAIRDIKAGEQLYMSYTECTDSDCEGLKYTYMTPDLLRDRGFLEQYPRRWALNKSRKSLIAELNQVEETGEVVLSWPLAEYPDLEELTGLQSQLRRLQKMEQEIYHAVAQLDSSHEKHIILDYYHAYKELLELAFIYREAGHPAPTSYDPLVEPKGLAVEGRNMEVCDSDPTDRRWQERFVAESHYQEIAFNYNKYSDNTCMYLSDWLQTCSNVRPHYHEAFVHVAGQYVDKVKRVAYLGGGDNMILHEILKYPDLELVVGMELDQQVCRSAFQYLGTLPYFDDPKVQWWFGDATKTLFALPESYFGSFDLVLVDLQTFVADALKVTEKLSIMDTAILLMKQDGGVIAKNEDFSVRTNTGFAKFTVDLEYHDLPRFCLQSITLGSNSVDFMTATPKSHGIETLAVDLVGSETWNPFHAWFGYRQSVPNSCSVSHPLESSHNCADTDYGTRAGILVIVEAEAVFMHLDSVSDVTSRLSKSIKDLGLTELDVINGGTFDGKVLVFILKEGYITARLFAKEKYVAFDLHIWDSIYIVDALKEAVISALEGNLQKVTSFRFVTSGMFGLQSCPKDSLTEIAINVQKTICNFTEEPTAHVTGTDLAKAASDVLPELIKAMSIPALSSSNAIVIGVVCDDEETPCDSVVSAQKIDIRPAKVVRLNTCKNSSDMSACEEDMKASFLDAVVSTKKIDVLLFDKSMPLHTGQVIERLFSNKVTHSKLLEPAHCVLSLVPEDQKWRSVLVDRFRTDIVLFDPANTARIRFVEDDSGGKVSLEYIVFSARDNNFFNHLASAITAVRSKTGLECQVEEVTNGLINVIADFNPPKVFRNSDYDRTRALSQWRSQTTLGHQTIFQMTLKAPKSDVTEGEEVLVERSPGPWDLEYGRATVVGCRSTDRCLVQMQDDEKPREVTRNEIRRISGSDKDQMRSFDVGDLVLYESEDGYFQNGVVSRKDANNTYSIYLLNTDGVKLYGVPATSLLFQFESAEFSEQIPNLTNTDVFGAFAHAVKTQLVKTDQDMSLVRSTSVGSGIVLTTFWEEGHAVLKWDGQARLEVNIFTYDEKRKERLSFQEAFVSQLDNIETLAMDEHPRGYGAIVNFASEIAEIPYWVKEIEQES